MGAIPNGSQANYGKQDERICVCWPFNLQLPSKTSPHFIRAHPSTRGPGCVRSQQTAQIFHQLLDWLPLAQSHLLPTLGINGYHTILLPYSQAIKKPKCFQLLIVLSALFPGRTKLGLQGPTYLTGMINPSEIPRQIWSFVKIC